MSGEERLALEPYSEMAEKAQEETCCVNVE